MDSRWLKGIPADQKESRKKDYLSYKRAFEDLAELLEREFEDPATPDYNSPSWAYAQADQNGANRMLKKVLTLIKPSTNTTNKE